MPYSYQEINPFAIQLFAVGSIVAELGVLGSIGGFLQGEWDTVKIGVCMTTAGAAAICGSFKMPYTISTA